MAAAVIHSVLFPNRFLGLFSRFFGLEFGVDCIFSLFSNIEHDINCFRKLPPYKLLTSRFENYERQNNLKASVFNILWLHAYNHNLQGKLANKCVATRIN